MTVALDRADVPVGALVDELGALRAARADLDAREKEIRATLLTAGIDRAEGSLFRVAVSTTLRSVVDWRAVAERLGASRQLVRAHTRETDVVTVRVSARRGAGR